MSPQGLAVVWRECMCMCVCVCVPGACLGLLVHGVAHGAELGHEEVVAPVVRGRVLLDVGELHKLWGRERRALIDGPADLVGMLMLSH